MFAGGATSWVGRGAKACVVWSNAIHGPFSDGVRLLYVLSVFKVSGQATQCKCRGQYYGEAKWWSTQ